MHPPGSQYATVWFHTSGKTYIVLWRKKKKRVKDSLLIKTDILLLAIMLYGVLFCQYVQALIKPTDVSVIGAAIRTCLSLVFLPILTVAISFVLKVS